MSSDDEVTEEFRAGLRDAVEAVVSHEVDWAAFHETLNGGAVASRLRELRRRASGGYRATAAAGAAWWDYAARGALASVPIGLAAALLLFVYLGSDVNRSRDDAQAVASVAASARNADSARAAFESVLTGDAAPRAVMAALIPVPADAIPVDSAGGTSR
jgi:hypothetical protein